MIPGLKRMALWLLLLVLIGWSAWQFSKPANAPQTHAPLLTPAVGKVHAIKLVPVSGTPIRLVKETGKWMLAGSIHTPANNESVQHLLNDLTDMHVIRVVTRTHAHDAELGMNTGTKVMLLDKANASLLTLTVGKQGSDLISTYVRIGQAPEVFAVDKALVWQVRRASNAWKAPPSKPENLHSVKQKAVQDAKMAVTPKHP